MDFSTPLSGTLKGAILLLNKLNYFPFTPKFKDSSSGACVCLSVLKMFVFRGATVVRTCLTAKLQFMISILLL